MRRSARFLLVALGLGLLPAAARAGEGEPAAASVGHGGGSAPVGGVQAGRPARAAGAGGAHPAGVGGHPVSGAGDARSDPARAGLARRSGRRAGRARAWCPTDLEQCQPLLLEGDGVVAACRPQDDGRSATGRRLVRLGPGREPVRLANALPLPGGAHLHPLGEGRLLVWAEAAERGPGEVGGDELIAAEVDATGRVLHQAIVSQPYVRRWPLGRGYLLLRQPPVGVERPGDVLAGGVGSRRAPAGVLARGGAAAAGRLCRWRAGGRRRGRSDAGAGERARPVAVDGRGPAGGGAGRRLPGRA